MNKTIFYTLIATAFFIQTHNHYAAEVNQPSPDDVYTRPLIVQAENGDSLELSPADLIALQSEYLKQLVAPEHELSVESIAVLPIATVRSLQLLLPGSQLAEAQYDDVVEATSLADLLMIPNGVDYFLKRLGRENIKLLCQLYQDPHLEGKEEIKRYIHPFITYKRTQQLGGATPIGAYGEETYNANTATGHTNFITSVALSSDNDTIITGSKDRTAIVWHRGADGQFSFNPQHDRLGAVDNENDPARGHTDKVTSVTLSPDGSTMISGSADHTLIVWHRGMNWQFQQFNQQRDRLGAIGNNNPDIGHTGSIYSVALSLDGDTIISGSTDRTLIVWHRDEDGRFWFNPQRDRLGAVDNTDAAIGHTDWVVSVALSQDGSTMISGSYDHTIIVWHRGEDGRFRFDPERDRLGAVNNTDDHPDIGHTHFVNSVALSPDGNTIITGSWDRTIIIWHRGADGQFRFNPQQDRLDAAGNTDPAVGRDRWINSVALSPDGNTIITGTYDHTAIVWQQQSVDEFCAGHISNKRRRLARSGDE